MSRAKPAKRASSGCSRARDPHSRVPVLRTKLERREVLLLLPLGDLDAVLVPLLALELDVAREDVLAERPPHEIRRRELVDRLAERLGQGDDPALAPLLCRQAVQVPLHRLRELVLLLDPLEAGVEQRRE